MNRRPSADRSVNDGRTRLIDTAEQLLDQYGIDGVSVRALTKASGHRNSSAVNYHFGSREQLIVEVLGRRQLVVEQRRTAMLEAFDAAGTLDGRAAVTCGVQPLADMLDRPEGRSYLRLLHQARIHPDYAKYTLSQFAPSILRVGSLVEGLVAHLPAELRLHRMRLGVGLALTALAEQARLIDTAAPPRPVLERAVFVADLVDAIVGALRA